MMFDVFPDDPDERGATGEANLRASLQRARRDRVPVAMPVRRYPIPRSQRAGGEIENRYRATLTVPVYPTPTAGSPTLARAIVQRHGGSITVSEPGEAATTFTVRLPTRRAAEPAPDQ